MSKIDQQLGYDAYAVAHCNWDTYPVISMNDKYTLYRSRVLERFLHVMDILTVIDGNDRVDVINHLTDENMRVLLVYKLSESKTYIRFKHYAKTNRVKV